MEAETSERSNSLHDEENDEIHDLVLKTETYDLMSAREKVSPRATGLDLQFSSLQRMLSENDDDDILRPTSRALGELKPHSSDEFDDQLRSEAVLPDDQLGKNDEVNDMDIEFSIFEENTIPPPPSLSVNLPTLTGSLYGGEEVLDESNSLAAKRSKLFESLPDYRDNFTTESRQVELVVSRVPEEIVRARYKEVDELEGKRRNDIVDATKRRERDLLWREHQARVRVEEVEKATREKFQLEREKIRLDAQHREESLGKQVRRVKGEIDAYLTKQEAYVREVHGEVSTSQVYKNTL
jgi:vacuolar-type H+-ATPase subunit H